MEKLPPVVKPKRKHILRNILIGIFALPVLAIIFFTFMIIQTKISSIFEKSRFEKLDRDTTMIFESLKTRSVGSEQWKYTKDCESTTVGWAPESEYLCETQISTDVTVSTVDEVNYLHDKYYPVIEGFNILKATNELDKEFPSQFGISFVVSSAEKKYELDNAKCTYLIWLGQANNYDLQDYGKDIKNHGRAELSFRCTDKAAGNWYNTPQP